MATTEADRCAFIRQEVEHKEQEIRELQETLSDPFDDLPPALKVKLQNMLERAKTRLNFLRQELAKCEAQN